MFTLYKHLFVLSLAQFTSKQKKITVNTMPLIHAKNISITHNFQIKILQT